MTELDNKAVNKFESLGSILESKSTTHPEATEEECLACQTLLCEVAIFSV